MQKISEMLLKLEGFQYTTPLNLDMGYYYIQLIEKSSNLCTIILLWENIVTGVYQWEFLIKQKNYN